MSPYKSSRNYSIISLTTLLVLCFNVTVQAVPTFRSDKIYPEMGLKMRVLGSSDPVALAQPKTYTYTLTRGDETLKQDRFDPYELWYASQYCGQWQDEEGNTLTIGRIQKHCPRFGEQHVLREVYDKAMDSPTAVVSPHDERALLQWVKHFAKCEPEKAEKLRTSFNFGLSSASFVTVKGGAPLIYLFQVTIRTPAGRKVPSDWFCAVIGINDGSDNDKVRKNFETQFLAKVAAAPGTYTTSKPDISSKELKISHTGSSGKYPDTPARAAARQSIANMKDWWFAETEEYIFLSDIRSSDGKTLVRQMQHEIPHLRTAFVTLVPPFEPITDTSVVRIFEDPAAYKQYVGETMEWSIGAWSPMHRELILISQGKNHDKTLEIIRHEGFHQYLFHSCVMIKNLPWFNEGHACFFESAAIDRSGRVDIRENDRVNHLLSNLDSVTARIPAVLAMDYEEFYDPAAALRSLNYTTAWALIYFLHKGAPLERINPYRDILPTYLKELKATGNPKVATTKAFTGIKIDGMQEDFAEFWKRNRTKARRYDPLKNTNSRF